MREYQKKRKNPYLLPHYLYMRTIYIIRDYERLKNLVKNIAEQKHTTAIEQLHKIIEFSLTGNVNKSTLDSIVPIISERLLKAGVVLPLKKTDDAIFEVAAIEKAMEKIPDFFRKPIYNNIISGERYPLGADERTFRRYKQRFIYYVARNLRKI